MATDKNNTNWGAAAFGGEVGITDNTTNTVDSFDPDQSDDDLLDVDVADSGNDSSTEANNNGNDNSLDLAASDILNDKSVNTDNSDNSDDDVITTDNSLDLSASDFLNDKSTDNSDNSDDDVITTDNSLDLSASDFLNDKSVNTDNSDNSDDDSFSFSDSSTTDSYNDNSTDDDTTISDSGNFSLSVDIADSFNDNDLIDIDSITGSVEGLQALGGNGNIFDLDQILTMNDQDSLTSPTVSNNDCFDQYSEDVTGGTASATSGFGDASSDADVGSNASASAGGAANLSAFNQDIAMGANIQYASVDMTVIGGSDSASLTGDDS